MRLFKSKVIIYKIDEISIYNVHKLLETNNVKYLVKKGDYTKLDLSDFRDEVINKYVELSDNKLVLNGLKKRALVTIKELYIRVSAVMLDAVINKLAPDEYFEQLKKHRIILDKDNLTETSIKKAIQSIQIERDKLDASIKEITESMKKETTTIYAQAMSLSKALELGYKIDVKKTSMYEWCSLISEAKKLN